MYYRLNFHEKVASVIIKLTQKNNQYSPPPLLPPPGPPNYWLMMTPRTHTMRNSCTKMTRRALRGLDFRRKTITLKKLFGLLRWNRAAVSGLDLWRLSRGISERISKWSAGIPSRVKKDLIPGQDKHMVRTIEWRLNFWYFSKHSEMFYRGYL